MQEGDQIDIVVGPDSRLSLEPLRKLDHGLRSEARLAAGEQCERLLQGGVELRSLDRDRFHEAAALGMRPALE
nr:hypothetical protein [Cyanobium sp. LEGE 06113]